MRITLKTMATTVALAVGALTLSACADPYYANQNYAYSNQSTAYAQPYYGAGPDYYYAQPRYAPPRYRRY